MSQQERLETRLKGARQFSEAMLAHFKTPQQWTHQVHPKANHALWFAGHMGVNDNFFISIVAPEKAKLEPGFLEKFGMGSVPSKNAADYPEIERVLAYMRDRRQVLLEVLSSLSDEDLAKPAPKGSPDFIKDIAAVFETAIWHEGMHSGQVAVAHRSLGNKPLLA